MAIGRDFEQVSALQLIVRAQARRIADLEGGAAYAAEVERRKSLQREYEARIRRLERELEKSHGDYRRKLRGWFDVFEAARAECERERDKAVAHAMRTAAALEERALRAERKRDELADALTQERRLSRERDARIEELEGRVAKLTAQVNRDFENSSVPSSMQVVRKKRVPNTREATGRRPGAQPGHPHHPRKKPEPTNRVEIPDPGGWEGDPDLYKTEETISKTLVSARLVVEATEYVAGVWRSRSTGGRAHAPFPAGLADEVTYDASVKALAFLLNNECCASLPKTAAFLREASAGALSMSVGMISGLAAEFSAKSEAERAEALSSLMSSPVMHVDFTGANVGGDAAQVLILANGQASMMVAREHKGHKGVAGTPLAGYVGCAVHDHDVTFYSYGSSHQECMQHNIRYLVGSTQNEPHLTWNAQMLEHVRSMIHWRNSLKPGEAPDAEDVEAMVARYDEILALAEAEYAEHPPTKYYTEGYNLFVRLRAYRESQLRFLAHLEVPPDNSLCERLARVFKRKQHAAIAFRSFEGLAYACEALATVNNMRLAGKDVFSEVQSIFDRPVLALAEEC